MQINPFIVIIWNQVLQAEMIFHNQTWSKQLGN